MASAPPPPRQQSLPVRQVNGDIINMEILQIPNATLEVLKVELGLSGKDISALTTMDKQRILQAWKSRRTGISSKPGDNNPAAGPSNMPMRLQYMQNLQQLEQNIQSWNINSPGGESRVMPPPPGGVGVVGGMMRMNPPQNLNQPPPSAGMNAGGNPVPGGSGPGARNPGGAPGGGGVGGGPEGASGMHFLGMNPMAGTNAAGTTGLGINMNMGMGMNPSAGAGGAGAGGGAGGMGDMGDLPGGPFSQEFMQGVENALSDIDPSLFRPDGDINFERDFGQWFNHSDDPLDLK